MLAVKLIITEIGDILINRLKLHYVSFVSPSWVKKKQTQTQIFKFDLILQNFNLVFISDSYGEREYFGKPLGRLSELDHGVSGEVYAVDARTLHLRNFVYDGQGPGMIF